MIYVCKSCDCEQPTPLHEPEGNCDDCYWELRNGIIESAIEYSKLRLEKARGMNTAEIGAKCGGALNKLHRLVRKLGE